MIDRKLFFDTVRARLFSGALKQSQIDGLTQILGWWEANDAAGDRRWLAYALATAHHETDRQFAPIEEYGKGKGLPYGAPNEDGLIYYGRGLVQLTWDYNYKKCSAYAGVDLVAHPELALEMRYAIPILFHGMQDGIFTGKTLADYFNATKADWISARRIINGTDKADLIAGYGEAYYAAITSQALSKTA